ncbi:MAG: methylmalonyl-CoA epimerase [Bacteroidetes bacterium]|nr:MAG: methylmalonyl-CoA epimerase [Bacteroidota bacterium]
MILRIEHIGIAVKSLEAQRVFEKILNKTSYKTEEVSSENVRVIFFQTGESKLELLESISQDGNIAKFIEKRGEGIHHVALATDDIVGEMERLKGLGFEFIYSEPKRGADNQWINFIHPKHTHGVLIELCEEIKTTSSSFTNGER